MNEKELQQKLDDIKAPNSRLSVRQARLRAALLTAHRTGLSPRKLERPSTRFLLTQRPVFVALAVVSVITLVVAAYLLRSPTPSLASSASAIALADPQVQSTFTQAEMQHLAVREADGSNGQKIVVLSAESGTMAVLGVDMAKKRVDQWFYDTVGINSSSYQLAFASNMNGIYGVYVVKSEGSDLVNLTDNGTQYTCPAWSPQRQQFAVLANNASIALMDYNGEHPTLILQSHGLPSGELSAFGQPAWSPDGSCLAFCGEKATAGKISVDIYTITGLNQGLTRLTTTSFEHALYYPTWSPDGSMIAFTTYTDNNANYALVVVNADGSGQRTVAKGAGGISVCFSWTPDSRGLIFDAGNSAADNDTWEIYRVNADGTSLTQLTHDNNEEMAPSVSPDGRKIAFFSNRDGNNAVYVMNVDGSGQTRLTDGARSSSYPKWSPDGKQLAYLVNNDADGFSVYDLYIMNADGTGQHKVATANSTAFSWVNLPAYPTPAVPQNTTVVPQPSTWPVSVQTAASIAMMNVPAAVANQAKITVGYGWGSSGAYLGEPYWTIYLSGINVTQQALGWQSQTASANSASGTTVLIGSGPYTRLMIELSGIDGGLRYRFAFSG